MNKHILSLALVIILSQPSLVLATALPKIEVPIQPVEEIVKTDITVAVGQEFDIPLYSQKNRFHDEWRLSSIVVTDSENKGNQEVGLELVSEFYDKEYIVPYDDFWARANCKLHCKFIGHQPGSYVITFTSGRVIACSYFCQTLEFKVHVKANL